MIYRNRDLSLVTAPLLAGVDRLWHYLQQGGLIINGKAPTCAAWFDGYGLDSSAKTITCRHTGTACSLIGSGSEPHFDRVAPHLGNPATEGPSVGDCKCFGGPDNNFGNVGSDDLLLVQVLKHGTDLRRVFKKRSTTGYDVRPDGGAPELVILSAGGSGIVAAPAHGGAWGVCCFTVDRDEASVNGSFGYWNAAAGSGVDLSAAAGSLDDAVEFRLGNTAGWDHKVALVAVFHEANLWPGGAGNVTAMDAAAKEITSLILGTTALHGHAALTPDSF